MALVGFAKSNKGLEFGWAQVDDQDQFYQRLSRNIRLIDAQLHNQWAHDPDTSFELSFAFFGGVISGESAWLIIPDGKVALTDDATNFVERDADGNVVVNTNEFTHPDLTPMAQVVTRGGRVITLIDRRPELGGSSAGGGSGQVTFPQILGVILQGQVPLSVVKQWEGSLAIDFTQLTGIATKAQLPASIAYEDEANIFSQSQTLQGQLIMTALLSQIVPGATSWAVRNNADSADNIIITDAGAITFRSTVGGITTLTAITLAGTLSTASQPNVTTMAGLVSVGTINTGVWNGTALIGTFIDESTVNHDALLNFILGEHFLQSAITTVGTLDTGAVPASLVTAGTFGAGNYVFPGVVDVTGQLIMSAAVSQLVPGATSFAIRDNADSNDNFLVEDDGDATVRKDIVAVTAILSGGLGANQVTKTANYTLTDDDFTVFGDASGGAFTLFLPTAVGRDGKIYVLQKIEGSANAVTVDADGSETINGLTTQPLNSIDDSIMIQGNGANWRII